METSTKIVFVSSNNCFIKRLDYSTERFPYYDPYFLGRLICAGYIEFYSIKNIDIYSHPFSVSIIDFKNSVVTNINNIWITNYNCETFNNTCHLYKSHFQAESINRGNLKDAYRIFLRKKL